MSRILRCAVAAALVLGGALASVGVARADVSNSSGDNVQNGSNRSTGTQSGKSKSGSSVGGQVSGVVSSGRTSVDAKNTSTNSDVTSGDARGNNTANTFTGLNDSVGGTTIGAADINGVDADNLQDGSNRSTYTQSADYSTGDGVAGQIIGAVTTGSANIVAANTTTDSSVETGDTQGSNDYAAFTGLNVTGATTTVAADINDSCTLFCDNVQEGNNRSTARQSSIASTGDGIAGQVIGSVSAGNASIDATNHSDGVDVTTGDATAHNALESFVGLNDSETTTVGAADVNDSCIPIVKGAAAQQVHPVGTCVNVQDALNSASVSQTAKSTSGDGVGGQVIGAVTSAGGSASVVAANWTKNSDITTGDATSDNALAAFVGLNATFASTTVVADVNGSCTLFCENVQDGNNRLTGSQTATSATGDGVAGQVLGVVSAGAASVDATNHTDDSSAETGDAHATNSASTFVGLNSSETTTVTAADVNGVNGDNVQDGSNRRSLAQNADASSGDAVAGQVSGVVTSAGGSASVVLANTSTSIDSLTGDSHFDNTDAGFVGLNDNFGPISIG